MGVPDLDKKVDAQTHEIEKPQDEKSEFAKFDPEQSGEPLDYSGAHEKTDPAEIKLVRKLDMWIMPTLVSSDLASLCVVMLT